MQSRYFAGLMKRIALLLHISVLSLLCACSTSKNQAEELDKNEVVVRTIQAIQAKYATDPRLTIFKITPSQNGASILLKGDVESVAAKTELVLSLRQRGIAVVDKINVLPSEALGGRTWGIVRISVANLRDDPGHGSELGTQVLMGHPIRFWKKESGWCLVQSSDRYLGWTDDDSFVAVSEQELNAWNSARRLIVTAFADRIWEKPSTSAETLPVSDVTMGALVKELGQEGDWTKVELPDKRVGYIAKSSVTDYEEWRNSRSATPENIERTAKSFLGLPYLWGGTSTKGLDCSGFTKTVYFLNGIQLLRNASHQVRQGVDVPLDPEFRNLKKGDLLFFGSRTSDGRGERVTHVGIYLGDKKFIHASTLVQINSLDPKSPIVDEHRLRGLLRAKRYLPD